jgi:hypothetical protein
MTIQKACVLNTNYKVRCLKINNILMKKTKEYYPFRINVEIENNIIIKILNWS